MYSRCLGGVVGDVAGDVLTMFWRRRWRCLGDFVGDVLTKSSKLLRQPISPYIKTVFFGTFPPNSARTGYVTEGTLFIHHRAPKSLSGCARARTDAHTLTLTHTHTHTDAHTLTLTHTHSQ